MSDYKITRRDPSKVYPKLPKILVGDNEETLVIYGDIDMTDYSELIRKARAVPGPTLLMTYPAQTTPDPLSNALADAIEELQNRVTFEAAANLATAKLNANLLKRIAELETELRAYKKERFDRERISSEIDDMNPSKDYRAGFHEGFLNGDWQRIHMRVRIAELEAALKMFADIEPYIDSRDLQPVYAFTERMSKAARAALKGEK